MLQLVNYARMMMSEARVMMCHGGVKHVCNEMGSALMQARASSVLGQQRRYAQSRRKGDNMARDGRRPIRGAFSLIAKAALAYASSRMQERVRGIAGYHSKGIDKVRRPKGQTSSRLQISPCPCRTHPPLSGWSSTVAGSIRNRCPCSACLD